MTAMGFAVPARGLDMSECLGFVVEDRVCDVLCHADCIAQSRCVVKYIIAFISCPPESDVTGVQTDCDRRLIEIGESELRVVCASSDLGLFRSAISSMGNIRRKFGNVECSSEYPTFFPRLPAIFPSRSSSLR